ncbi:MAG TPA: hypothetical protein ENG87_03785, partial [Candidatus Pacearchaeota archaeon]|nr:hypothetical protein [Candidatus Pacearchaeota archaeon]
MKKGVYLFSVLIISLMLVLQLVIAADVNVSDADDVASKIDKAYGCLEDKVVDNCDSLSLEEKIFSLLALGECKEELIDEAEGDKECWPSGSCDLKLTALATLALDSVGTSTANAEEWLLSQNTIPSNIDWFLEIENSEDDTSCTVTYSDDSYDIDIGNNKKLSSGAGSCLSLESHEYWLKVAPNCYDLEFDTSCDKGFLTTLLFKKDDSSTIHVSENAHKASAEGITTETVNSLCFAEGSDCDYEGSLWATLVLDYLDNDVSAYIPYLVTMADENEKYLPEAFLYLLTGYADFKNDLLLKQKSSKYWDEAGDKFYDTALALYPFQSIEPLEKQNSKDWLLEVQGDSGCWDSENTRNTAFILYSLWPRRTGGGDNTGPEDFDCEEAGFFCVSKINCDGIIKSNYECSGTFKCCTEPESLDTCDEQGGDICNSVEECVGGMVQSASDLDIGQECCIGGSCQTPADETEC